MVCVAPTGLGEIKYGRFPKAYAVGLEVVTASLRSGFVSDSSHSKVRFKFIFDFH
jgi:hypothetical protein